MYIPVNQVPFVILLEGKTEDLVSDYVSNEFKFDDVKKIYIDSETGVYIKKKNKKLILVLMHDNILILDNNGYLLQRLDYNKIVSWKSDLITRFIKISYLDNNKLIVLKSLNPRILSKKILNITKALSNNDLRSLYNLEGYNYDNTFLYNSSDEDSNEDTYSSSYENESQKSCPD